MILTHAQSVFDRQSLVTFISRSLDGSPWQNFFTADLQNRVVAIENYPDTPYEKTVMRHLLSNVIHEVLAHVNHQLYTHEMFQTAAYDFGH